jgi:hypothetical protein
MSFAIKGRRSWIWNGFACLLIIADTPAEAKAHRSGWARMAFRAGHPCPSTGATRGACPGFVIDHSEPICAGGADAPFNMRWQARPESLVKDRLERAVCRAMRR